MHSLLEKQKQLQIEAKRLLDQIVVPVISSFGEVSIGGSYAYKLLGHPDLDIDIVTENLTKEMYVGLCAQIIALDCVSKFKTADRITYPHTHSGVRPMGYWISPEIQFGNNVWTLDIWLQKPEWYTGNTVRYSDELKELDDESRITILLLKEELRNQNKYGVGKDFQSIDVYEGVLHHNVKTIDDLRLYKQTVI